MVNLVLTRPRQFPSGVRHLGGYAIGYANIMRPSVRQCEPPCAILRPWKEGRYGETAGEEARKGVGVRSGLLSLAAYRWCFSFVWTVCLFICQDREKVVDYLVGLMNEVSWMKRESCVKIWKVIWSSTEDSCNSSEWKYLTEGREDMINPTECPCFVERES